MSAESRCIDPTPRVPTADERRLIDALVRRAGPEKVEPGSVEGVLVRTMDDGGMGSLRLYPTSWRGQERAFGEEVAGVEFLDADGVLVDVTLNLDKSGELFEVDSWRVDFGKLLRIPQDLESRRGPRNPER